MENNNDKIYIEKGGKLRLVVQQEISEGAVLDFLATKYKVSVFNKNGERLVFVEEENNNEK